VGANYDGRGKRASKISSKMNWVMPYTHASDETTSNFNNSTKYAKG
jgi:hypothetical protein